MKILYIDQPLNPPGGGQISLFYLLKNIKEKYEVKIFIPYYCEYFEWLRKENINVKIVTLRSLYSNIKNFSPDVIHCNSATTKYTFIAALSAKILKIPFIWHNRVTENAGFKEKLIAKLATKIVVISDAVKEKFNKYQKKVVKVYNAVDIEKYKPNLDVEYLYKEFNLSKNDKIIGIFSRLDWWKGHKLAIDAFKLLCGEIKNVKLLIIGEGPYKKEIVEYAKKSNIFEKTLFLGFRKDIPQLMNLCDIVLNPSVEPEAFGRTIIEAMACGKVVIATNIGGQKEIIKHKYNGFLVSLNPQEIVDIIKKILTDPLLSFKISQNARLTAENKFSIKNHIIEIENLYKNCYNEKNWYRRKGT